MRGRTKLNAARLDLRQPACYELPWAEADLLAVQFLLDEMRASASELDIRVTPGLPLDFLSLPRLRL